MYPLSNRPKITTSDVARGYVDRYFVKYIGSRKIVEVDKQQYFRFVQEPNYQTIQIKWIIDGNDEDLPTRGGQVLYGVYTQNQNQIEIYEQQFPGLRYMLPNPLEYFVGKKVMYVEGDVPQQVVSLSVTNDTTVPPSPPTPPPTQPQLAEWTIPTFSPAFHAAMILHEPVSGNLVMMAVGSTSTQPLYTSNLASTWTSATGLNVNFDSYANGVVANGVIVVAGNILSPYSRAVARSTDGGVTWTTTSLESTTGFTYNQVAYDSTYGTFLHYSQGEAPVPQVRESADNGATWSAPVGITVPAGYDANGIGLNVCGGSGLGVLVCSCTNGTGEGMLYSTDGGYTFLEATITGDYDNTSFGIQGGNGSTWCGDRWVFSFADGTGTGFLTSVDGITWVTVRPTWSTAPVYVTALAWNDAEGWLYAGTDDGVYLSSDFTTFSLADSAGFAGTNANPDATWFGNVIVQMDTVFAATANPILYALAFTP